jgi:hypothetical protein
MAGYDKYIFESVDLITGFSRSTGDALFILDQPTDATWSNSLTTNYASGRKGIQLAAFDREKASNISGSNGYIVGGLLAAQIGAQPTVGTSLRLPMFDILVIPSTGDTVETSRIAAGTAGAELLVYKANTDMTQGEKFEQDTTAAATKYTYDPSTKEIEFPTSLTAGDSILVFYEAEVSGKQYSNNAETSPSVCKAVFDITLADICDANVKYAAKLIYPNAKLDGNFDISFGDTPAVHAFNFTSLLDPCRADKTLWDLIIPDVA